MMKKIIILILTIALIVSTTACVYAAFTSGITYEKKIEMPNELKALTNGGV